MYADNITVSMFRAISETNRRRSIQQAYNEENGIRPESVRAAVKELMSIARDVDEGASGSGMDEEEKRMAIEKLEERMLAAAADLDFEAAAKLRDQMLELKGEKTMATNEKSRRGRRKRGK
jgi:excinuclease ABC subunit B